MSDIIDFHSHILPGIDDGSDSQEESMALLRMAAEQGIGHVIATPHFYAQHETPEEFLRKRRKSEEVLRAAMRETEGLPRLSVGAEVYFFRGMSETEILPQLTIDGKNCILIEMPPAPWQEGHYQELEAIWRRWDITPVIAHIDRYIGPFRTYRIPQRLRLLPVLVQANASFFLKNRTRRMALKMLREDQIQLLGSDCHNLDSRLPNLGPAVQLIGERLGKPVLGRIRAYQESILSDHCCNDSSSNNS